MQRRNVSMDAVSSTVILDISVTCSLSSVDKILSQRNLDYVHCVIHNIGGIFPTPCVTHTRIGVRIQRFHLDFESVVILLTIKIRLKKVNFFQSYR